MKIVVKNLTKKFKDRVLYKNFSFEFKEKTFYSIVGESGCGKSTFLNLLSLNDPDFEGEINYGEFSYSKLTDSEKRDLKIKNFGFVFQNFNLFEEDTVYNNLRVVLDSIVDEKEEVKLRRVEEILKILDIEKLKDSYVRNLSGGEKQRVAIGRALITSPEYIFCDEPTGSLDEENTIRVFELLKEISSYSTIILVTHDKKNAEKYSDYILEIKDEKISPSFHSVNSRENSIQIMNLKKKKKYASLSSKFIFGHFKNLFKIRKIRNLIKSTLLSLSFISAGLAITLTSSLNNGITSSFSSLLSDNQIVIKKKNSSNKVIDYYSSNNQTIQGLLARYPEDIRRYGVNYLVDFENYFIDGNDLYSINSNNKRKLTGFTARHFNEFIYFNLEDELVIYPEIKEELKEDEIVLSLSFDQMKEMCLELQILRNFESLGNYLKTNDYYVSLELANYSWQYTDEQVFKIKGVVFDNKNRIYHTSPIFNETVFEEKMRFPTSNKIDKVEDYPRMFKKVYFIETKTFQSSLLNKLFYDERYKNFIFDIDSSEYSPLNYDSKSLNNKIYVYDAFKDAIDIEIIDNLKENGIHFDNYFYSTPAGYFNNGMSIFTGFNNPTFFSLEEEKLDNIIDAYSRVKAEEIYNIEVPENVVDAFALKPTSDNVKFKVIDEPLNLREIIISKGFAEILSKNIENNEDIYVTMLVESTLNDGILDTTFRTIKLKIRAIIEEDKSVSIYQNKDYSISLFRDLFKVSSFRLIPNSIILEMNEKIDEENLKKLNTLYDEYEFQNPLLEIEKSVNESTSFLRYILYAFALISLISSIILSFIITYINANEQRNEIRLLKILGFKDKEILKMFVVDNIFSSFLSILVSFASLIFINFLVGNALGKAIGLTRINLFNALSIFTILALAILIVFFASFGTRSVIKEEALN